MRSGLSPEHPRAATPSAAPATASDVARRRRQGHRSGLYASGRAHPPPRWPRQLDARPRRRPRETATFAAASARLLALLDHHVGVVGVVRQLQPQVLIAAHGTHRIPNVSDVLVLAAALAI